MKRVRVASRARSDGSDRTRTIGGTPMSTMTVEARKRLLKSDFGLPGSKKYPMPDPRHAANAKARASQQEARGKLSASAKQKIDAKANRILGKNA